MLKLPTQELAEAKNNADRWMNEFNRMLDVKDELAKKLLAVEAERDELKRQLAESEKEKDEMRWIF